MKARFAKQILTASGAAVISLMFSLMPLARAHANSPYLKVLGGDVSSGGWFNDSGGNSCINSPNFQDNNYNGDNSYGGIYTFAQNPGGGYEGASSAYAAFALGQIDGGAPPAGFYSGAAMAQTKPYTLSFANLNSLNPPGFTGGLWGGNVPNSAQCIADYYDTKKPANTSALGPGGFSSNNAAGVASYTMDGTAAPVPLMSSDVTIAGAADISIFVNGDVYINHNIFYAAHNAANVPRFVLVAQGSIFIDPAVSRLDGLYIAQPNASTFNAPGTVNADPGTVWTCHDGTTALPANSYVQTNCHQKPLIFNGSVIAKQINLLRLAGDVGDNNANPAESFNYDPDMVIGGRFFPTDADLGGAGGVQQPVFQSIISLPPVF